MGFRFWRRIKLAPGLTLNLSKSGGSLSLGPRGAKFTVGSRGKRATVGLPGTGLFYTTTFPKGKSTSVKSAENTTAQPLVSAEAQLQMGFLQRLALSKEEKALVDGFMEVARGNDLGALDHLKRASCHADGAFMAGFLSLKHGCIEDAGRYLHAAVTNHAYLGAHFRKYGLTPVLHLPITEEIVVEAIPGLRSALLGLVEVYQSLKRWQDALTCLERLRTLEPNNVLVKVSLAELMLDARPGDRQVCHRIVRLAEGIENDSEIHAALLLYKARALRCLGLLDAARQTLSGVLRKTRNRSEMLLLALRYERGLVYEELGQANNARKEFERIYAESPLYEDVARRLGI